MTMAMDVLRGRVAIVTGGSKGLGLAKASGLLRAGASIAVAARNGEAAEAAAAELRALGGEAMSATCDVRLESRMPRGRFGRGGRKPPAGLSFAVAKHPCPRTSSPTRRPAPG